MSEIVMQSVMWLGAAAVLVGWLWERHVRRSWRRWMRR